MPYANTQHALQSPPVVLNLLRAGLDKPSPNVVPNIGRVGIAGTPSALGTYFPTASASDSGCVCGCHGHQSYGHDSQSKHYLTHSHSPSFLVSSPPPEWIATTLNNSVTLIVGGSFWNQIATSVDHRNSVALQKSNYSWREGRQPPG